MLKQTNLRKKKNKYTTACEIEGKRGAESKMQKTSKQTDSINEKKNGEFLAVVLLK